MRTRSGCNKGFARVATSLKPALHVVEISLMAQFSHLDESGKARMVDVTGKPLTLRTARACGRVKALPETLALIQTEKIAK